LIHNLVRHFGSLIGEICEQPSQNNAFKVGDFAGMVVWLTYLENMWKTVP
jgi:hypothetical protein